MYNLNVLLGGSRCGSTTRLFSIKADVFDLCGFIHQSIPSVNIPPGKPPGNYFEVVKSPALGQNFSVKARPPGQKNTYPREYFRRSSQPFLLTGVKILGFCRNQTLKRIGRLSNYSLVILSSFSLSILLKSFKVFPQR